MRLPIFAASSLGGLSVVMGAMGGHGGGDARAVWMTGVYMGLIHAVASICATFMSERTRLAAIPGYTFTLGGALFGGSIWIKTLVWGANRAEASNVARGALEQAVALMAPLGGLTLILSWILLAIAALRLQRR